MDYSQIIGKNIAEFRKAKALTQEQLGDAVGVTGQAVSKWENGGMPDAYLLPKIAAALGVSVDRLFELEHKKHIPTSDELLELVGRYGFDRLQANDGAAVFKLIFEMIFRLNHSAFKCDNFRSVWDIIDEHEGVVLTSQLILNEGTTYISLVKDMPYLCVTKDEPGLIGRLLGEKGYCELFGLLSDPDGLKAAIFTQSEYSKDGAKYTADRLAEKMGIQSEKFRELLPMLLKFQFLHEGQLVVDESEFRTYFMRQNNEFRPLLMTAWLLINSLQRYYTYCQTRETRFLEKQTKALAF